jgi:NAD(P)-dependent dehydrogenase (short-subunit alcohol dehydrogenase family)
MVADLQPVRQRWILESGQDGTWAPFRGSRKRRLAMMNDSRVALVTGVSSGIGQEISRLLEERGLHVFGTARKPGPGMLRLDVTDDASVAAAVQSVLLKGGRIDVLVNNAGYALAGAIEETTVEEAQEQFDTNFFGVLRMVRAVLPEMRRKGHGRIANISSMAGLLPIPYRGIYSASKHALEGYTETLDHEVRRFGVRAALIEPTFTRTNLETNRRRARASLETYTSEEERASATIVEQVARGDSPRLVAEAVYRAITDEPPRLRYPVGRAIGIGRLRRFVPARMFDRQFRRRFQLDVGERTAS